ncbi:ABC transporter substrate-binding protein [Halovenus salina]|uniref:ABC transporter substrate-binding protein n=1 Tax=Halovenus salina TaxID=1510225 RepID=A0ABD5W3G3_9EURY|nr:ABC transporter substrate-binding protein [Halovenus salina]
MSSGQDTTGETVRRRAVLASIAAGTAGTAGCLGRLRTARSQELPDPLSLEILTLPGDADPVATQIGRRLAENLEAAGIEVDLTLYPEDELRRAVLIEQEYDLFVCAHPNIESPDMLRPLLHSKFVREPGWQNPFEMTDINIDELLEAQQSQTGDQRRQTVAELQHEIVKNQPFIPIVVPDAIQAARTDRFSSWEPMTTDLARSLTQLEQVDPSADTLRLVSTNDRLTQNLNPIAIEYPDGRRIIDLLYDSLGRYDRGTVRPWAADSWDVSRTDGDTLITATLRSGLEFHDGTPLTAADVVFSIEFLTDTSLGEFEVAVPAPRFRGRTSIVETATAIDEQTVALRFPEASPQTAVRALTVPILPKQEWETASNPVDIAGVDISEAVTDALVRENLDPVGSGPLQFDSLVEDERLVLTRNDDHPSQQASAALPEPFAGGLSFDQVRLEVVRSDDAALGLLADGEADATLSTLSPSAVPRAGREPAVELSVERSPALYLVGCNTTRSPLGNPYFRRFVARLIDKDAVQNEVLDGFARPATTPLTGTSWVPSGLRWNDEDPEVPFFGNNGELDSDAARTYLQDAGFEFAESGELLEQ